MKELYTIGEISNIMGLSVQTLRNYSNLGLLKPQYIDEMTGYRYYSFNQFHVIDRIKYLRGLGVSLQEINEIMNNDDIDSLKECLIAQQKRINQELKHLQEVSEEVEWYLNYFNYRDKYSVLNTPYIKHFNKRYIMFTEYVDDDVTESVETRLAILKHQNESNGVHSLRQYGFILNTKDLLNKKLTKEKYFTYIKNEPTESCDYIMELPEGNYVCFMGRICTEDWDTSLIASFLKDKNYSETAVAEEYEDSLKEFKGCPYEVQILIR